MEGKLLQEQSQHEATSLNKKNRIRRELKGTEELKDGFERYAGKVSKGLVDQWSLMAGDRGVVEKAYRGGVLQRENKRSRCMASCFNANDQEWTFDKRKKDTPRADEVP